MCSSDPRKSTKQRALRDALDERELQHRHLLDSLPQTVFEVDLEGNLVYGNPSAYEMWGISPEAVPNGINVLQMVAPEDRERTAAAFQRVLAGGPSGTEFTACRGDGTTFPALVHSQPVYRNGRLVGLCGFILDMTEAKRAEEARRRADEQARRAQKLESLAVLAGRIARDFNSLLAGIFADAVLALNDLPAESPARASLQRIETAALRAAELGNRLLACSGNGFLLPRRITIQEIVSAAVQGLDSRILSGAALTYSFAGGLPPVEADATHLRQVVENLIVNAAEAMNGGAGTISIRTSLIRADRELLAATYVDDGLPAGDYLMLAVSDTGCGMDDATLARIFEPFFTTKSVGRGLGLAAVLGVVRSHRGAVRVRSKPGKGTTFEVLLPPASDTEGALA